MLNFRYRLNTEGDRYPVIPVTLSFRQNVIDCTALVDSGAMTSVFRDEVADELGVVIEKGKEVLLHGVGGLLRGYVHDVAVDVAGKQFRCPVVFSRDYLVSFNLLGREGFFEQFQITFDERRRVVRLE